MGTWRVTSPGPMSLRRGRPGPETRSSMRRGTRDQIIRPRRVERAWADREAWAEREFGPSEGLRERGTPFASGCDSRSTRSGACSGEDRPNALASETVRCRLAPHSTHTRYAPEHVLRNHRSPGRPRAGDEAAAKRGGRLDPHRGVLLLTGAVVVERGVARPNLSLSVLP